MKAGIKAYVITFNYEYRCVVFHYSDAEAIRLALLQYEGKKAIISINIDVVCDSSEVFGSEKMP